MKKTLCLLFVVQLLILSFSQLVLSQEGPVVSNPPSTDKTENVSADELKKLQKGKFNLLENTEKFRLFENIDNDPDATFINFDDLIFSNYNSIAIAPNRYQGVVFYSPYAQNTWLTYNFRSSNPNSLIVGTSAPFPDPDGVTPILSTDQMVVEFTQPSKDVAFLWGNQFNYYNSGQIYIYNETNQLVTIIPVSIGSGFWTSISLNQYSQRIKKLVLVRPPVSNNRYGHIHIENFQFTPVTTQSPVGWLDGVNIQIGKAFGWSRDPDDTSVSNYVDCYVAGHANAIGRVLANLPGEPAVGNHRFEMPIPINFRDGNTYQLSCYGLDAVGGDPPTLLSGSPKTFKFNPPEGHFDEVTVSDGYSKRLESRPGFA